MKMRPIISAIPLLLAMAFSVHAQTTARSGPAKAEPVVAAADARLSQEDRVTFFVHHARLGETKEVDKGIDSGIDINAFDTLDQTALIAAISHLNLDTVRLLLDRGANPKLADNAGWTPLIHAVFFGANTDLLGLLLDKGAAVNAQNDRGVTALYLASALGREEQVRFLLDHGADPAIATKSGYTALRIAQLKGTEKIVTRIKTKLSSQAAQNAGVQGGRATTAKK